MYSELRNEKIFSLPAILLWAAGQMAEDSGNLDDLEKVLLLFKKSIQLRKKENKWFAPNAEKNFLSKAKENIGKGIIPFKRSELDLNLAAILFIKLKKFKIRSNNSYVDPGFLRVINGDIEYVNFSIEMKRYESSNPDFFEDSKKLLLLNFLDEFSSRILTYETVNQDQRIIKIAGEFEYFSKFSKSFDCLISLWNAPTKTKNGDDFRTGGLNRRLGSAKIEVSEKKELFLSNLSAQSQLEITAASLVDQWLLIESDQLRIFGQLPDLTEEGDSRRVSIDPIKVLSKFLLNQTPVVFIDKESASYFSKKYSWFVSDDSQTWLEAATQ